MCYRQWCLVCCVKYLACTIVEQIIILVFVLNMDVQSHKHTDFLSPCYTYFKKSVYMCTVKKHVLYFMCM